ncbi:MAG: hypothetical protein FKY71_07135 [Spiribacter salinus]|uniref:ADP-ribosylglycohydrolase family protein n=1 Tax=Spiribacter salinus TaxID=1335746 RepID=A0A540VSH3_9GAMM|nr:MAG: hypothetical protein FKY71_07135 [Spiribacter salinus]
MLGAIAGDIIGSIHEFGPPAAPGTPLFQSTSHFTDDTVLTLATARCLLGDADYATAYREGFQANREQAWGVRFKQWGDDPAMGPYESFVDILLALKDEDSYRAGAGIEPAPVASVGSCLIGAASTAL